MQDLPTVSGVFRERKREAKAERKRARRERRAERKLWHKCFWTWPLGHVWEPSEGDGMGSARCVACHKPS